MDTNATIEKLKNARRFLYELRELEEKYGLKFVSLSKNSPTEDTKDYLSLFVENGEYELGMECDDLYPGYCVALEEV